MHGRLSEIEAHKAEGISSEWLPWRNFFKYFTHIEVLILAFFGASSLTQGTPTEIRRPEIKVRNTWTGAVPEPVSKAKLREEVVGTSIYSQIASASTASFLLVLTQLRRTGEPST